MWRRSRLLLADIAAELEFPLIVRPRGSHAGVGLAKLDDGAAHRRYLAERPEAEFFVSRFVDYASEDGLFRKYRVVFVDRPALRLPHGDRRSLGYLVSQRRNVRQRGQASRRRDLHAHLRHRLCAAATQTALAAWPSGSVSIISPSTARKTSAATLLIFEADNTAVVHNMDSPAVFPYKPPQMRKIFEAFAAMLYRRANGGREHAA